MILQMEKFLHILYFKLPSLLSFLLFYIFDDLIENMHKNCVSDKQLIYPP
jgi:hypothetical protein